MRIGCGRRLHAVWLVGLLWASVAGAVTVAAPIGTPVSVAEGVAALDVAKLMLGVPYVWAGQHVTGFDCSGLVVFAFEHTIDEMIWRLGDFGVLDVNADDLYRYNSVMVPFDEAQPGDLVFATRSDSRITHIGLFSRWLDAAKTKFEWVQASSARKAVVLDTWKIGQTNNGNRLVGLGRVLKWAPDTLPMQPTEFSALPTE